MEGLKPIFSWSRHLSMVPGSKSGFSMEKLHLKAGLVPFALCICEEMLTPYFQTKDTLVKCSLGGCDGQEERVVWWEEKRLEVALARSKHRNC